MVAVGFKCKLGNIKFEDCLNSCKSRCLTKPILRAISSGIRQWTGKPSTTQLLNGIREVFLSITNDFYIDPQNCIIPLVGTGVHDYFERFGDKDDLIEFSADDDIVTGKGDLLSAEDHMLWDYKTSGSYKVAKCLGLEPYKVDDPWGNKYLRSGKGYNKGDLKQITKFRTNPKKVDMHDYELQQNRYRIILQSKGYRVDGMNLMLLPRDAGSQSAFMRGVTEKSYICKVKLLDDAYVLDFYKKKATDLKTALKKKYASMCTVEETWDGRKCKYYCDVREFCDKMGD